MSKECQLSPWSSWDADRIQTALQEVVDELGYVPAWSEYDDRSKEDGALPSHDVLRRAYGGYPDALRASGIDPREVHGSIEEALRVARQVDAEPVEIDERTVYLAPAAGPWYASNPGRWHTPRSCAGRGIPSWTSRDGRKDAEDLERIREVFLEKAVKEGFRPCRICAMDVEHGFEPADYPPGTLAAYRREVTA